MIIVIYTMNIPNAIMTYMVVYMNNKIKAYMVEIIIEHRRYCGYIAIEESSMSVIVMFPDIPINPR